MKKRIEVLSISGASILALITTTACANVIVPIAQAERMQQGVSKGVGGEALLLLFLFGAVCIISEKLFSSALTRAVEKELKKRRRLEIKKRFKAEMEELRHTYTDMAI